MKNVDDLTDLYSAVRFDRPPIKDADLGSFLVRDIFTDFKRHDLGPS